jgi:phage baseplate assembly protein W
MLKKIKKFENSSVKPWEARIRKDKLRRRERSKGSVLCLLLIWFFLHLLAVSGRREGSHLFPPLLLF